MLVVVAVLVVVVMLVVSYRALSGGENLDDDDYRAVLQSILGFTQERSGELVDALATGASDGEGGDPMTVAATAMRKKLAGYQQQLSRFEDGAAEHLESARSHLSTAIEDLGWACRMIEPGTYRTNPAIRSAVAILREHGEAGLAEVNRSLGSPGGVAAGTAPESVTSRR